MITVRKLNVVKEIDESELPDYEAKGFNRVDKAGRLIPKKKTAGSDDQSAAIEELEKALSEKDAEIEALKAALSEKDAETAESEDDAEDAAE